MCLFAMTGNLLPFYPLAAIRLTDPAKGADVFSVQPVVVRLLTNILTFCILTVTATEGIDKNTVSNDTFFDVSAGLKTISCVSSCIKRPALR